MSRIFLPSVVMTARALRFIGGMLEAEKIPAKNAKGYTIEWGLKCEQEL